MSEELQREIKAAAKALFHGSTRGDINELKANQPNMGSAGVYGADNLDWAALYALAKDRKGMAVVGGANPKLLINKANKLAPAGHVYEYAVDNPTAPPDSDPNLGWHIPGNATPLRKHIVKLVDHMKNIEQFDDKKSLQARWKELNNKSAANCKESREPTAQDVCVVKRASEPKLPDLGSFKTFGSPPSPPPIASPPTAAAAYSTWRAGIENQAKKLPYTPFGAPNPDTKYVTQPMFSSEYTRGAATQPTGYDPAVHRATLGSQIARWYSNIPGGLDRAVAGAQQAQQARDTNVLNTTEWPRWKPEAVTQYQQPVVVSEEILKRDNELRKKMQLPAGSANYSPALPLTNRQKNPAATVFNKLFGAAREPNFVQPVSEPHVTVPQNPVNFDEKSHIAHPQATLDHELSHGAFELGNQRLTESSATNDKNDQSLLQKTIQSGGLSPYDTAAAAKYPNEAEYYRKQHKQQANYLSDPSEIDVRLAEIKRRYAYHTGQLAETPEAAQKAWEWWRQNRPAFGQYNLWDARENAEPANGWLYQNRSILPKQTDKPTMDWEDFEYYDRLPDELKQKLFHRMPELVQRNHAAYSFGAKQANNKSAANMADENSERQIGSAEKSADLAPEVQLQPHQERVKEKFEEDNPRMLLYHGLGSGKSLSAIAAAEAAKTNSGEDYGIVVPASLRGNFQKELEKFTTGSSPEIMSYTGLGLGKKFTQQPGTVIMDEAHRIRNPAGAAAHAARDAAYKANRLLLLTGSPITNSPADLANLVSLLKRQPISPQDFEKKYIGSKKVYPGLFNYLRGISPGQQAVIKNEGELRNMLRGHVDYQPSKTPEGVNVNEEKVLAPLTSAQQKIQKALRTKIPPSFLWKLDTEFPLNKDELSRLNSFLTGLRQNSISTAPFRKDGDPLKAFQQSGKLQLALKKLREVVDSDPRKKAIIYSNHIGAGLDPYAAALAANNIPYGVFHGGIPTRQRQQALKDYNEGRLRALLIGPAGAEGLSTKGTNLIQILDPHWHESRTQQARGRGLRFDSHDDLPEELKNVHVQRFISKSEDPSFLGKMLGYRRERTGDEILERLSNEKEKFNEKFRQLLREVGSENHAKYQKQAGVDFVQTAIDSAPIVAGGAIGALPGIMTESPEASKWGGGAGAALGTWLAWRNANQRNKLRAMAGEQMPDNKSLFDYEIPMSPAVLAALGVGAGGLAYAMKQSAWARFSMQEKEAGVRFYKRLPINKNMALNFSFGGPSLTLRKLIPGTSLTLGNRAPRVYVSTPIPGLAYQQYLSKKKHKIKAEKEFPDEPDVKKDEEPDNRSTWERVRDFVVGSEYGDTDED